MKKVRAFTREPTKATRGNMDRERSKACSQGTIKDCGDCYSVSCKCPCGHGIKEAQ